MRWRIHRHKGMEATMSGPDVVYPDSGIEVISASYTDEDVERVAEAIYCGLGIHPWRMIAEAGRDKYRVLARAALDAYLKDPQ